MPFDETLETNYSNNSWSKTAQTLC